MYLHKSRISHVFIISTFLLKVFFSNAFKIQDKSLLRTERAPLFFSSSFSSLYFGLLSLEQSVELLEYNLFQGHFLIKVIFIFKFCTVLLGKNILKMDSKTEKLLFFFLALLKSLACQPN